MGSIITVTLIWHLLPAKDSSKCVCVCVCVSICLPTIFLSLIFIANLRRRCAYYPHAADVKTEEFKLTSHRSFSQKVIELRESLLIRRMLGCNLMVSSTSNLEG